MRSRINHERLLGVRIGIIFIFFLICILFSGNKVAGASISEAEPNDSSKQANPIAIGQDVYGSSGAYNRDWFRFVPPISGNVKLYVWCTGADVNPDRVHGVAVDVYDVNKDDISYNNCVNDDEVTPKTSIFAVQSGNIYYVRARNDSRYDNTYYHFKLEYSIDRTKIKKVKGGKKKFTVTWAKNAKASFYQIQYTKKSVFDDYGWNRASVITVSSNNKSKTIKKLAKKKPYFVRVRVARNIQGIVYYSPWSQRKTVKTK